MPGTPLGDKSKLPPPRTYAEGWTIGKPDIVFELPEEVNVPATGTVEYQYYETPTNFKEDVWIQAAEARPGNRKAVHHIIAFYRDPKFDRKKQRVQDQWIAGTAPGDMALVLPPGVARKIPAGATIVWQMHYTPTGKEEKDRSQLGLIFYKGKTPPEHNIETHGIGNHRFLIPPGDAYHEVKSEFTVPRDATVLSFMPHMHLRGKDFLYRAAVSRRPRDCFPCRGSISLAEHLSLRRCTCRRGLACNARPISTTQPITRRIPIRPSRSTGATNLGRDDDRVYGFLLG